MGISIRLEAAIASLDVKLGYVDAGAGAPTLVVYDGTPPAYVSTALSGNTVLLTYTLATPAAFPGGSAAGDGNGAESVMTPPATATVLPTNPGLGTFYRIIDGDGTAVQQGDAGTDTANDDLVLTPSASIVMGVGVTLGAVTMTEKEQA